MVRRTGETTLDRLTEEDFARLSAIALAATEQLVTELAESAAVRPDETGGKPGDTDDEPELRLAALRRVKAGQLAGLLLAEVAAEFTAQEAGTAVWHGASLADLGSASGSTRQAARKRWPDLGQIYRSRRWLYGYREDIRYIVELFLTAFAQPADPRLAEALDALRAGRAALADEGSAPRWRRFGEFVNQQVRAAAELAVPETDEQRFATDGITGLLGYYDSVLAKTTP